MKVLYTSFGTVEIDGESCFLTNYIILKKCQLKLITGQRFVDASSTWLNVYLLLDDDCSVLRFSADLNFAEVDLLRLSDPEWRNHTGDFLHISFVDLPETDRFAHFGLKSILDQTVKADRLSPSATIIACTDADTFLVRNANETAYLYCIDSAKNDVVLMNIPLPEKSTVKQISCGKGHGLILDSNGIVYSFGCGTRGELGHGTIESAPEPTPVTIFAGILVAAEPTLIGIPNEESVLDVSCGSRHTLIKTGEC
ncbi:unnamed protein product [Soboliphyme baturini]|uniref:Regulator of chromosome condensation n=1 Tax=Soboliphyme baturini TaxID=241478 RepID=A0A183IXA9_9BILA|nr:unnamed protein product [Soboliphyme baturini]